MSGSASAATPDPDRATDAGDRRPASSDAGVGQGAGQPPPQARPPTDTRPPADAYAQFLVTSEERDAAEARLRHAVADEVLSLEEFGDRMRLLLAARTRGELQEAVAGLPLAAEPVHRTRERGTARPAREHSFILAVIGGTETRGRWRPSPTTTALAVMGGTVVDLQGAEFEGDVLTINAVALMGAVEIVVPEGVDVELSGFAIMGGRDMRVDGPVLPHAPLVRVHGYAVMGGVEIRHPKPKELRSGDDRGAFADRVPVAAMPDHDSRARRRQGQRRLSTVRQWAAGLLAAAALALPLGWVLSSDEVAGSVFGSTEHVVTMQDLEGRDELTVGAPVAFGSVAIEVPEGVNVEYDGMMIFGSREAPESGTPAADAPTVRVRTLGGFGSVQANHPGADELDLD